MKNLYAALFMVLLIPFWAAAQSGYRPGYLVLLNRDTLHGFINCKTWNKNPIEFAFKDNVNSSQVKSFSTANATAVVVPGYKIYKRFVLDISQDDFREDHLSPVLNTKHIIDTVFLELIDSGRNVTLYQYTDKIKERFFVHEKNANPVELILHVYANPDHFSEPVKQETYKRQLQSLAVKYLPQFQPVVDETQEATYNKEEIEKIVFEINGADKTTAFTSTKQYKARPFGGIGFHALSVHNFATNHYLPQTSTRYDESQTQQSVSGEINLGEDIFLNPKEKSMIVRVEAHCTYSGNNTITDGPPGNLLEQYHTLTISLNPQLLFNIYNSDGTKIYIGGGGQLFTVAGASVSYIQPNYDELNPPGYRAMNFTLTLSADIILNNKFDIYAGYNPTSPLGQHQNTLSAFRAGVNYLLGAK